MASEGRLLTKDNSAEIAEWCGGRMVPEKDSLTGLPVGIGINLLCGDEVKRASVGDVIIRNHNGTFDVNKTRYGL